MKVGTSINETRREEIIESPYYPLQPYTIDEILKLATKGVIIPWNGEYLRPAVMIERIHNKCVQSN